MKTATKKEAVRKALRKGRWTPGYELTRPDVGGTEGLRRLRELRAEGLNVQMRRAKHGNYFEYRITR